MPEWTSNYITVNSLKLHYHRTGGSKAPLILCHGLTDNGLCWLRIAQILEKDYDLIMYDARGHGLSEVPSGGYTAEDHAADVVCLIEALGLERPHLLGHSMGAATVSVIIANHPQLVGRAILEDPPWFDPDKVKHPLKDQQTTRDEWQEELLNRKAMVLAEKIAYGHEIHPTWHEIEFGPWCESTQQADPVVLNYIAEKHTPWREIIPKIKTPTLLITADVEAEALVSPKVAAEIAQQANIEVVHISGAGHSIRREQFEQYVEVVTTFLMN